MVVFLAALALVAGCDEPVEGVPELRVGLLLPLSWEEGFETGAILAAAELALEGPREETGFEFTTHLVKADSGGGAEVAVEAIRRLVIRDRVHAIVGPFLSRSVLGASPMVEQLEVPVLTPTATHPEVGAGRRFTFRVAAAGAETQGAAMAELAIRDLGASRGAVLFEQTDLYSRRVAEAFRDRFVELGGEPFVFAGYPTGIEDYELQLERIRAIDPQVLLLPNNSSRALEAQMAGAREQGIDAVFLGGDTWNEADLSVPIVGEAYYADHWNPAVERAESLRFVAAYEERYSRPPTVAAALTYDTFGLLLAAVARAESVESRHVRDALTAIAAFPGVTGDLGFAPRERGQSLYVVRVNQGKTTLYRWLGDEVSSSGS